MSSRSSKQPKPAILDWAPAEPLADETPAEHIRNALQALYELEALLVSSGDFTADRRTALALAKRRLGWALQAVERPGSAFDRPVNAGGDNTTPAGPVCEVCGESLTAAIVPPRAARGWCGTCQSYR